MTPEMWMSLSKSRLDKGAVHKDNWRNIDHIFDVQASWVMINKVAHEAGINLSYDSHKEVFAKMKHDHKGFQNMKNKYRSYNSK